MAKKIIVAGLGHGGIAAAAILAESGYDVTVYEKQSEGTLGYDWTDIFAPKALKIAEMDMPDEDKFEYKEDMTFVAPNGAKLRQHVPEDELEIKMERKDIYDHFIKTPLTRALKSFTTARCKSRLCSATVLSVSARQRAISLPILSSTPAV